MCILHKFLTINKNFDPCILRGSNKGFKWLQIISFSTTRAPTSLLEAPAMADAEGQAGTRCLFNWAPGPSAEAAGTLLSRAHQPRIRVHHINQRHD